MAHTKKVKILTYEYIQSALEPLRLPFGASYLYGFLIANVLQGQVDIDICLKRLVNSLSGQNISAQLLAPIRSECETLIGMLYDHLFGDEILLDDMIPHAEMPLSARIFSISEWLRGFLYGTGEYVQQNLHEYFEVSDELLEMMDDFATLVNVQMDEDDTEENEKDFMEIIEYIKIGVLLLATQSHFYIREKEARAQAYHH